MTIEQLRFKYHPKEVISTLECEGLTGNRRDGNTIRQTDFAIQQLFKGKIILIEDHYENGKYERANKYLFDKIIKRLENEHNLNLLIKEKKIVIRNIDLILELL